MDDVRPSILSSNDAADMMFLNFCVIFCVVGCGPTQRIIELFGLEKNVCVCENVLRVNWVCLWCRCESKVRCDPRP